MQTSLKLKETLKFRVALMCCTSLIGAKAAFAQHSPPEQSQQSSATALLATTQQESPTQQEVIGQNITAPPAATPAELNEIVVTSTRIERDGYQAPTPMSVIGAEEIAAKAPANIADFVNELPSLVGSNSPRFNISSVSAGLSGINALNLRDLGGQRTLVLLDGQRVGAATLTDLVDVNEFPEQLIKRIDVVTGGASADWGSDAVAGVVNFVLDKDFTGIKGDVQGGATTYGDDRNYKVSLTAGTGFLDNRGHFLFSAQDAHNDGITGVPRPWANENNEKLLYANPAYVAGNGQPQYLVENNSGFATATPGGIITSGPLKGTYFGPGGIPAQFNYGPLISGNFMQGGQAGYANFANTVDLDPETSRQNLFLRTSFDVTDNVQVFGQASYGKASTFNNVGSLWELGNQTISANNAFIPGSTAGAITAYNTAHAATPITSFTMGTFNEDLPLASSTTDRSNRRFVIGANGDFNALGSHWTWDAYSQETITDIYVASNLIVTANYNAAINAVRNPTTGAIQCASIATRPSCVPYDIFGTGVNSSAAINYVMGTPWLNEQLRQNVEAANLRGNPFSDWAGPVSVATGVEHRKESADGSSDAADAAALETTPVTPVYFAGNFHPTDGSYEVTEGYFETVVPLAKDLFLAKSLDLNGAVRATDYSTSGYVTTWKVGLTWSPIDDISLRGTRSRDIRAPDLSELFAVANTVSAGVTDPKNNNAASTVFQVTSGNPELKPELADTTDIGVILRPSFMPGFTASVDYYDIHIADAITTLTGQQEINECYEGDTTVCSDIVRNASGAITQVGVSPVNFASQVARGLDIEATYRKNLETIAPFLKGEFTVRSLATHFLENTINSGIAGVAPINNVGDNSEGAASGTNTLPHWKYSTTAAWDNGSVAVSFTARGVSAGVINSTYIQCTTNCPTATVANPTISNNSLPGAIYFDTTFSYKLPSGVEVYGAVDNLVNKAPPMVPYGPSIGSAPLSINPVIYDTLGRVFRMGVRFKM
jgi:iron complex outermembrane recepter protein